jgi:hypothetical protein
MNDLFPGKGVPFFERQRSCEYLLKIISVVFLLLAALVLRIWDLPWSTHFEHDHARDVLVIKHLAEEGDYHSTIVPYAAGFGNKLPNTFFYYRALTWLWSIRPQLSTIIGLYVFVGAVTCANIFALAYLLGGYRAGICALSLGVSSNWMIKMSRVIWQPCLLPLFISFSAVLFMAAKKYKCVWLYFFAVQVSWLGVFFHYDMLPFVVLITVLTTTDLICRQSLREKIITVLLVALLSISNSLFIYANVPHDLIIKLDWDEVITFVEQIHPQRLLTVWSEMLQSFSFFGWWILLGGMIAGIVVGSVIKKKKIVTSYFLSTLALFCGSLLLIAIAPTGDMPDYYLAPYLVLLVVIIGYLCALLPKYYSLVGLLILVPLTYLSPFDPYDRSGAIQYSTIHRVANAISEQPEVNVPFTICWINGDNVDEGHSPGVWYFLETKLHRKLIKIVPSGYNFEPFEDNPEATFYICADQSLDECRQKVPETDLIQREITLPNDSIIVSKKQFTYAN